MRPYFIKYCSKPWNHTFSFFSALLHFPVTSNQMLISLNPHFKIFPGSLPA